MIIGKNPAISFYYTLYTPVGTPPKSSHLCKHNKCFVCIVNSVFTEMHGNSSG